MECCTNVWWEFWVCWSSHHLLSNFKQVDIEIPWVWNLTWVYLKALSEVGFLKVSFPWTLFKIYSQRLYWLSYQLWSENLHFEWIEDRLFANYWLTTFKVNVVNYYLAILVNIFNPDSCNVGERYDYTLHSLALHRFGVQCHRELNDFRVLYGKS